MSVVLTPDLDTSTGKAARYGTTTTSWRQEHPGLWVATRDGNTIAAIHLTPKSTEDATAVPAFTTLEDARAHHTRVAATPVPVLAPRSNSRATTLRSALRPVGQIVLNALQPTVS